MSREKIKSVQLYCIILSAFFLLSFNTSTFACDIIFKNTTGVTLKIVWFMDSCDNVLVNAKKPLYLKPGEKTCFIELESVMHHYKICANSTCQTTSVGVNLNSNLYIIEAVLKGKQVSSICQPNIWPGITLCGKIILTEIQWNEAE